MLVLALLAGGELLAEVEEVDFGRVVRCVPVTRARIMYFGSN